MASKRGFAHLIKTMSQHEIITEQNFQRTEKVKTVPKIVKFINFSNEDFTYTWNKVPYVFPAGEFRFMEKNLGDHFAKHLVNRELLKLGKENDTSPKPKDGNVYGDNESFKELYMKAIEGVDTGSTTDKTALEQEVIDRQMRAEKGLPAAKQPLVAGSNDEKIIADPNTPATEGQFEVLETDDEDDE